MLNTLRVLLFPVLNALGPVLAAFGALLILLTETRKHPVLL